MRRCLREGVAAVAAVGVEVGAGKVLVVVVVVVVVVVAVEVGCFTAQLRRSTALDCWQDRCLREAMPALSLAWLRCQLLLPLQLPVSVRLRQLRQLRVSL